MQTPGLAFASALLCVALAGCPGSPSSLDASLDATATDATMTEAAPDVPADVTIDRNVITRQAGDCDPLDPAECAYPWPSNLYLVADPTRATGYTLTFGATSLPLNADGLFVDPSPYRRFDGYDVGTSIMTVFPSLDSTALATEDHVERSIAPDAAVLLYAVHGATLTRVPYFVEPDGRESARAHRTLFVRPAVILEEATRYIVAFRNLVDIHGVAIPPSTAFAQLRDRATLADPTLVQRQARFEEIFGLLAAQGVARDSLILAWDFVTASDRALHATALAIRDDAFATTGAQGPMLSVTDVTEFAAPGDADAGGHMTNPYIALELHGTFTVPSYLRARTHGSGRGFELNRDSTGVAQRNGTRAPEFWVRVPRSALGGPAHGLMHYGHGLFGSGTEVRSDYLDKVASDHHLIYFAADLTGMTSHDVPLAADALQNLDDFIAITDPLHQGLIEWLLLARAMRERLATVPEIVTRNITIDRAQLFYSGNSQGGIFGASYTALSTDVIRAHLGVPGNNYETLLQRSADFSGNSFVLGVAYRGSTNTNTATALMGLLWNQTDPVSYYRHLRVAPFANTPPHDVLIAPAKGDHQVAVVTNEIAARSGLGIAVMAHYDSQRSVALVSEQSYPYVGSGLVLYDFGNPWPTLGNHPPVDPLPDPHELPRRADWHNEQMVHFLRTGEIEDVCGGDGCHPM